MKNVGVVIQTLMNGTSYWANLISGKWKQDLDNENPPTHDKYETLQLNQILKGDYMLV
jgi:hypothetical protein